MIELVTAIIDIEVTDESDKEVALGADKADMMDVWEGPVWDNSEVEILLVEELDVVLEVDSCNTFDNDVAPRGLLTNCDVCWLGIKVPVNEGVEADVNVVGVGMLGVNEEEIIADIELKITALLPCDEVFICGMVLGCEEGETGIELAPELIVVPAERLELDSVPVDEVRGRKESVTDGKELLVANVLVELEIVLLNRLWATRLELELRPNVMEPLPSVDEGKIVTMLTDGLVFAFELPVT